MSGEEVAVSVLASPAKAGEPWRVTVLEEGTPAITLLFEEGDDGWQVQGFELPRRREASIETIKARWDQYVELARVLVGWEPEGVRPRTPQQAQRHSAAFYRDIAERYRELVAARKRPTSTIAQERGVARSTASRWVRKARELEFLGDAPGERRAGEIPLKNGGENG